MGHTRIGQGLRLPTPTLTCQFIFLLQTHLIHEVNVRCNEAENTAAELESAASHQMKVLAKQTEGALQAANEKLKRSRKFAEELESFVRVSKSCFAWKGSSETPGYPAINFSLPK